jgi:transposase InsO family protein
VLEVLHAERFWDTAPASVYATLLDEGSYLCSTSTMYRLLRQHGETGDRRRHATHPATVKPELLASGPNECWSWDITKLAGPAKWTWFYLYVILDILQPLCGRLDGGRPRGGQPGRAAAGRHHRQPAHPSRPAHRPR